MLSWQHACTFQRFCSKTSDTCCIQDILSLSLSLSLSLLLSLSLSLSLSSFFSLSLSLTHTSTHGRMHLHTWAHQRCARSNPTCFLLPMSVFCVQKKAARSRSGDKWRPECLRQTVFGNDAWSDAVWYLERYPKLAEVDRPPDLERRRQLLPDFEEHGRKHPKRLREKKGRSLCSQVRPSS